MLLVCLEKEEMGRNAHSWGSASQFSQKLVFTPLYVELVKCVAVVFFFLGVALLLSFFQECLLRQGSETEITRGQAVTALGVSGVGVLSPWRYQCMDQSLLNIGLGSVSPSFTYSRYLVLSFTECHSTLKALVHKNSIYSFGYSHPHLTCRPLGTVFEHNLINSF